MQKLLIGATLLAGAASIAGCSVNSAESAGPRPDNWRAVVTEYIRSTWYDPCSMRDAQLAAPVTGTFNFQSGWIVCFRANAKNRMGAYTGLKNYDFMLRDSRVVSMAEQVQRCEASDVNYVFALDLGGN